MRQVGESGEWAHIKGCSGRCVSRPLRARALGSRLLCNTCRLVSRQQAHSDGRSRCVWWPRDHPNPTPWPDSWPALQQLAIYCSRNQAIRP